MIESGCASSNCDADGMNLYATGFPDTGFNFEGFVILTVMFVHGEASRYCEVLMGVCLT